MHSNDTLYGRIKNGVLTLSGNITRIAVRHGMLVVKDGFEDTPELEFIRADCPVSRIVAVRTTGIVTLAAIRWMHDVGVAFAVLDWDGTPLLSSPQPAADVPALRRAQALGSVEIVRDILRAKIVGQATVIELLGKHPRAGRMRDLGTRLADVVSPLDLLTIEAMAAIEYWITWQGVKIRFARAEMLIPDHWKVFGTRRSLRTGSPRNATTPGNALLNYLYGVLSTEISIALYKNGLDPSIGLLHTDKQARPSLTYDAMEAARPIVDLWLLNWLDKAVFSKRDFYEDRQGGIRVTRPLNSHLAMSAPLWWIAADEIAEWIAQRLAGGRRSLSLSMAVDVSKAVARWWRATHPIPNTCLECGRALPARRRKYCSNACREAGLSMPEQRQRQTAAGLAAIKAARGKAVPDRVKAMQVQRAARNVENAAAIAAWKSAPGWSLEYERDLKAAYELAIRPRLGTVRPVDIARALGVSAVYAIQIRKGRVVPHVRHVATLAQLAGVEIDKLTPSRQKSDRP